MDNTLILLGAGASHDAGLPLASELTKLLHESLKTNLRDERNYLRVYELAWNFLKQSNPGRDFVYEDILSLIQFLSTSPDRDPAATLIDRSRSEINEIFEAIRSETNYPDEGRISLNGMVAGVVLIDLLKSLILADPTKIEYLKPLLVAPGAQHSRIIATLNYDETIETTALAMGATRTTLIREIEEDLPIVFTPGVNYLLKLHGSMTWRREREPDQSGAGRTSYRIREAPYDAGESLRNFDLSDPLILWNPRSKVSVGSPFFELLYQFRKALHASRRLLVIGYSFNDTHINQTIDDWHNTNKEIIIINGQSPMNNVWVNSWKRRYEHTDVLKIILENAATGIENLMNSGFFS